MVDLENELYSKKNLVFQGYLDGLLGKKTLLKTSYYQQGYMLGSKDRLREDAAYTKIANKSRELSNRKGIL